jgi:hypothetical protein
VRPIMSKASTISPPAVLRSRDTSAACASAARRQGASVESPRRYVRRLVIHAKWAGHAQREQPKVTRGRRCVSQKVAVAEVGGCRRTRQ